MAKVGRKSKVANISAAEVKKLAAIGCTQQEIGDYFGVSHSQISRNFAQAYVDGITLCKLSLRRWQLKSAKKSVDMQKWLGKQMLGQREPRQDYNVSGTLTLAQAVSDLMGNKGKDADRDK